jgi:hypothetical protein
MVNVGGVWKLVQRQYVNEGGTWRFAGARTPTSPLNVILTVNGSSSSSLTVNSSPLSCDVSWAQATSDQGLPVEVVFHKAGVQVGTTQNILGGTIASQSISISSGEIVNIVAYLRTRNGSDIVSGNDVYSNQIGSTITQVTYPAPSLGTVNINRLGNTSDLSISWTVNNPPSSNYYYLVSWSDSISNPSSQFLVQTTSQFASLPFSTHGTQLYDTGSATITFYVTVTMYINNVQVGNPAYGSAAFFTSPEF